MGSGKKIGQSNLTTGILKNFRDSSTFVKERSEW
jgi:hypothetical protein